MTKSFWTTTDFDLFAIEGLEKRMTALQQHVQPKFTELGEHFSHQLSAFGTGEFFPHVAKHARRTVNPPTDSWVAFAPSKRGYKALPHFQIGLWGTHLFIIVAVIYENPDKKGIAERLEKNLHVLTSLPNDFAVSGDHMKPEADLIASIGKEGLEQLLERLHNVKKAEFLIGVHLSKEEVINLTKEQFYTKVEQTFEQLFSVYNVIIGNS